MTLGDCFFTPETEQVRRHLWILVSDPAKNTSVVIVNTSSKPSPGEPQEDRACVVVAGEHRALTRDSHLRCEQARLVEVATLEQLIKAEKLTVSHTASADLVLKAQAALGASRETPLEVKAVLRAQGFIIA